MTQQHDKIAGRIVIREEKVLVPYQFEAETSQPPQKGLAFIVAFVLNGCFERIIYEFEFDRMRPGDIAASRSTFNPLFEINEYLFDRPIALP